MKLTVAIFIAALVSILSLGYYCMTWYGTWQDVDSYVNRAQVAADSGDMIEYLTTLESNLQKRGMTKGNSALIFKSVDNDMSLYNKSVVRLLERLNSINDLPKNEVTYQTALDDIRGVVRELPNPAASWTWAHYWYLVAIGICIWLLPVGVYFFSDDY